MHRCAVPALLLGLAAASATAQQANPYDGSWRAAFEGQRGAGREGKVVISGQAGSWDMAVTDRKDPCVGRAAPISVQRSTPEELVFEINRSKALAGCKDTTVRFRRVDDNVLQGGFGGGRAMTLTRE